MTAHPPRRLLLKGLLGASLALPALTRHALAQAGNPFALGIASGSPTPASVVLWTRLVGEGLADRIEVQWELAHDEAFTQIAARGIENAIADEAHSVHAMPNGLDTARGYWYRFRALGQQSRSGFTRTAPAPGAEVARLTFQIASCQRFEHGHYAAWRDVAENPPELVLFLGDYIYEYPSPANALRRVGGGRTETLSAYRQRYADYKADPHLQAAHAVAPWLFTWDDHEVENDYATLVGERLQPNFAAQRAAAYRAWWEHMPVPMAMKPVGPDLRIYGSLDWGRLARFHVLDDRQYRDGQLCPRPDRAGSNVVTVGDCPAIVDLAADAQRSLLGREQEQWLAGNWSLERPWNLLAQQTLMARFSRTAPQAEGKPSGRYWTDGWDGYPASRDRLLRTVVEKRVPGVVALGGDVHCNYVADLKLDFDDTKGPIVASEFCGTSITSNAGPQGPIDAALPHNPHVHHGRADQRGTVRFTLDRQRLAAELRVVENVREAGSKVAAAERFVVEAARPGVQRG